MPAATAARSPGRKAPEARRVPKAAGPAPAAVGAGHRTRVAVAEGGEGSGEAALPSPHAVPARRVAEPVWLVRAVLVLFLVGFASFLARELYNFLGST